MTEGHRVVIVGGGFGGLYLARALKRAPVSITLIDRRNFHLFQPLLYQVATGGLSPANIAAPLRGVLKRQRNAEVVLGEATEFDTASRRVLLKDGASIPFDTLVVATGCTHHYFGHPEWERLAPGLKTVEDATEIRRRILLAFESAERESAPQALRALLTFLIVGAGPTGVELAGALAEIAKDTLRRDFRRIDPASAKILLVEGASRVLPGYPAALSQKAEGFLERLGVEVRTRALVTRVEEGAVEVRTGEREETISAKTVLWAAGVQGSSLGRKLAKSTGAEVDKAGRVIVGADCSVPGHPEIFALGDLACMADPQTGEPLPGVAPVAMQQGKFVAKVIRRRLAGRAAPTAFRYRDYGSLATIGRAAAVAVMGPLKFSGLFAWLTWLFVHLMKMVEFENRLLVFVQWAWAYVSFNRSARLITGDRLLPVPSKGEGEAKNGGPEGEPRDGHPIGEVQDG